MATYFCCLQLFLGIVLCQNEPLDPELASKLEALNLPDRFSISVYAYNTGLMRNPRQLDYFKYNDSVSIVYVGSEMNFQPVYALIDLDTNNNNNNESDFIVPFLDPDDYPEYRDNSEINGILVDAITNYTFLFSRYNIFLCYNLHSHVFSLVNETDSVDLDCIKWMQFGEESVVDHLRHSSSFSPDYQYLCIPFGANCDVCSDPLPFQTIRCYDMNVIRNYDISSYPLQWNDTNSFFIAMGVRNSVGFDFDINSNNIWFGDMDANTFGNDATQLIYEFDSELNVIDNFDELAAMNDNDDNVYHFGYPYYYSSGIGNVIQREVGEAVPFQEDRFFPAPQNVDFYKLSKQSLGPRASPLGLKFYNRKLYDQTSRTLFPSTYDNVIFLALHGVGSMNRDYITGHKIISVNINNEGVVTNYEDFVVFLKNVNDTIAPRENRWARPAFIEFMDDGSMLMSDDFGHMILRIKYDRIQSESSSKHPLLLFDNVVLSVVMYCIILMILLISLYFCYKRRKKQVAKDAYADNIPLL